MVSGYPATWLLTKRVSAVSIKNQNAEAAMRSLVSAAKPWPRLRWAPSTALTPPLKSRPPAAVFSTTARPSGRPVIWGSASCWTARAAARKAALRVLPAHLRPEPQIQPQWGNLLNAGWSFSDTDYANVALVQGAGEGDERATVWGDVNATGSDRREMYVDARDVQPEDGETSTSQSYLEKLADRGGEAAEPAAHRVHRV